MKKGQKPASTVRVKIIIGSLVILVKLSIYFPQVTVSVTVLKFGRITITVTVSASAVPPSSPLIPNYHLESHLNEFSENYRYRYRLEMFLN